MGHIDDGLVEHLAGQLAPWAQVDARRMFGGWGVYRSALMFGLIAGGAIYLKSGPSLREAAGDTELKPFVYDKPAPAKTGSKKPDKKKTSAEGQPAGQTRKVEMSYALVPPDVLDDSEQLCRWAQAAWQDALAGRRLAAASHPHASFARYKAGKTGRRA